jgi:hypothetical protein
VLRKIFLCCVLLLALLSEATTACAEKRIALVVGNSGYENVARLDNPANDATLMAGTLKELGFSLVDGEAQLNLTKAGLDLAIQTLGRELECFPLDASWPSARDDQSGSAASPGIWTSRAKPIMP